VLWAGCFFWWSERRRKFCVRDYAIEGARSGGENNGPKHNASHDRMNSVSKRNQTRHACDQQRGDTDGQKKNESDEDLPQSQVLICRFGFHAAD